MRAYASYLRRACGSAGFSSSLRSLCGPWTRKWLRLVTQLTPESPILPLHPSFNRDQHRRLVDSRVAVHLAKTDPALYLTRDNYNVILNSSDKRYLIGFLFRI